MPWLILWFTPPLLFTPSICRPQLISCMSCWSTVIIFSFPQLLSVHLLYYLYYFVHRSGRNPLFYCYLFIHLSFWLSVHLPLPLNWSFCPCIHPIDSPLLPLDLFKTHPPTASVSQPNWIPTIISILSFCSSFFSHEFHPCSGFPTI